MKQQNGRPDVPGARYRSIRGLLGRYVDRILWFVAGGSSRFWDLHYRAGGSSGPGSLGDLRTYKASFVNNFVREHGVSSVIEFGCGNGDQLEMGIYPRYIGLDVSASVLKAVGERFANDHGKSFFLYSPDVFRDMAGIFKSDLALSLDVLFHLTEDEVYYKYITDLFCCSSRWVVVYSSNRDQRHTNVGYTRHRRFTDDVAHMGGWELLQDEPNPFSHQTESRFYVFRRES